MALGVLDIGKFGGLAETMDESIRYAIRTPHDGAEMTPCVLAGPTCDSADVMYEKLPYRFRLTLEIGDKLLIEGTGPIRRPTRRWRSTASRRCGPTHLEASLRSINREPARRLPPLH